MKQAQRRRMAWKMPSVSAQGLKIFACVTLILGSIGMIIFEKGIINVEQYKANELNDLLAVSLCFRKPVWILYYGGSYLTSGENKNSG